jgi:hypothetical protein
MAKKEQYEFKVTIQLNLEKGGGWLVNAELNNVTSDVLIYTDTSAWKNSAAAKRWVKQKVVEWTPRKSVKLTVDQVNAEEKPTKFVGELSFKEAV